MLDYTTPVDIGFLEYKDEFNKYKWELTSKDNDADIKGGPSTCKTSHKYTIVFDLDETLLHSFFPHKLSKSQLAHMNKVVDLENLKEDAGLVKFQDREFHKVRFSDNTWVFVQVRPYLAQFLKHLTKIKLFVFYTNTR